MSSLRPSSVYRSRQRAFTKGQQAYRAGKGQAANPYRYGANRWVWRDGWEAAKWRAQVKELVNGQS